ncbi:insulinase family protein [Actinoplanes sp. DH11]|uniref:insulinase family protein n=1 Tax=Actinoplanes sp. DH11 TaxID=2857011 RepID=UPI001E3AD38A|nr:insulinase family protein [Actinoplanes sp. DH11]
MPKQLEVDGVPAVLAPVTGPMHAGLVFRVGVADEPLVKRGITHLIEHLAVHGRAGVGTHTNSTTGVEHTYFHARGTAEHIAAFLNGVCAALRDLPAGRIDAEKDVLRAEAGGRRPEPRSMWRHGARDYGMPSFGERGLPGLTGDDLHGWVAQFFTRENAALWVAGDEVPPGLRLNLPEGVRQPAPMPSTALPVTPAWFAAHGDGVAWDTVVRREARAAVFANVLERQLLRELGGDSDDRPEIRTEYEPRVSRTARISAIAEAPPERRPALLAGLTGVLSAMRAGRIRDTDVSTVVDLTCAGLREADERGGRLPGQAVNVLAGRGVRGVEEAVAEVRAVTVDDVAEVSAAAYRAGLLMAPAGTTTGPDGWTAAPGVSEAAVTGRTHRARGNRGLRLVHGADGVSVVEGDAIRTVRYDACAAVYAWPDGGRRLIGDDAIAVRVEPTLYRDGAAAVADIDARTPPGTRIEMPPRDPERIPQPRRGWREVWGPARPNG